jgi:pyruvate dehydrogenase E1 component beta subunit
MRQLSIREALNEALDEEMARDDRVFLMGEEVGYYDGAYKVSRGLLNKYGEERVVDTPISENGFSGVGVGAAMAGLRPVIEFMNWDFSLIAIDQIINSAAKVHYMTNGEFDCPIVFRGSSGSVHQLAAQHSQSFESIYVNCPGLKVILPCNSYDAKGLLKSAIRDPNPVIFMESEAMYGVKSEVPEGEYIIPIGEADIKKRGSDITIITWSKTVSTSLLAAEELEKEGISAEVIDLRTLRPFDEQTVYESVKKTNRVLIVEEACPMASFGSWVSSKIATDLFDHLDAPPLVHSGLDYPYPYAKNLEYYMRPRPETIIEQARRLL